MKYYRFLWATLSNFSTVSMEIHTRTNNAQVQKAHGGLFDTTFGQWKSDLNTRGLKEHPVSVHKLKVALTELEATQVPCLPVRLHLRALMLCFDLELWPKPHAPWEI